MSPSARLAWAAERLRPSALRVGGGRRPAWPDRRRRPPGATAAGRPARRAPSQLLAVRRGGRTGRRGVAAEQAGDPAFLLRAQAEREPGQRPARQREQGHERHAQRPVGHRRIADQRDAGVERRGAGQAERAAPAGRQAGDRRCRGPWPSAMPTSTMPSAAISSDAAEPAGGVAAHQPQAGDQRSDRQEQQRRRAEQHQQQVAGIGARSAQPIGGRPAGGGGETGVGAVVGGQRNAKREASATSSAAASCARSAAARTRAASPSSRAPGPACGPARRRSPLSFPRQFRSATMRLGGLGGQAAMPASPTRCDSPLAGGSAWNARTSSSSAAAWSA